MTEPTAPATDDAAPSTGILARYAEIFLKGLNRAFFEKRLVDNMRRAVGPLGGKVERLHGRVLVMPMAGTTWDEAAAARCATALSRVFGLSSISPVRLVERDLAALCIAAVDEARAAVAEFPGGRPRFKVETRRSDKRFLPSSPEVSRIAGGAIVETLGLPVDVHDPDLTVGIEIGFDRAFVFARSQPGPGGLPVGTAGKVDLLLSGGIDSPVAGWLAMKRGCDVAATYFHSFPFTGDKTRDKVVRLARRLASWQGDMHLRVVPFTEAQKALRDAGDPRLAVVLYRRMMLRVAEALAVARGAKALVTGDALAQVASQTLDNLAVVGAATSLPVLRPLITNDKIETIRLAQRIDTYELSIEPYEDCCQLFVPDHPETHARLEPVLAAEAKLDMPSLVKQCVDGVELIHCRPG